MQMQRKDDISLTVEETMEHELDWVLGLFDNRLYFSLLNKDVATCEKYLKDLCFSLLELQEEKQVFVARISFVSIITDLIHMHTQKERLHVRTLAKSYDIIRNVEAWENLSAFILHSKWFAEAIISYIVEEYFHVEGCQYVEQALQMIHQHLEEELTVK